MAYTTIDNPFKNFNTKIYTGTGSSNALTGVGFQTDWTWIKDRDSTENHNIFDTVRTATKRISSNRNNAEDTQAQQLTAFGSDGFTVGTDSGANHSGRDYVSWNWLAGGTASSNGDGSITSNVSANTTAGFSIVSYTGTGANATIGHGLGAVPKWIVTKDRNNSNAWYVYHVGIGNTHGLRLSTNDAKEDDATLWNDTTPTSSVFSVGSNTGTNRSANPIIAYCFAEVKGYSKFGTYTGNGNADGAFIYTGFKPAFIIFKRSDAAENWALMDNKLRPANGVDNYYLYPDLSNAQDTTSDFDMLSNGFKTRTASNFINGSGATYLYIAIAESPFVTAGTKAAGTAR